MSFQHVPLNQGAVIPPSPSQRRARVRYRCPPATLGRLFIANSYKSLDAWIQNLSQSGVGLLLGTPLEPGSWVMIELDCPTRQVTLELSARVVHATRQHDGSWIVGCAFADPLSDNDLDALL